jgi:hypothetical protein
VVQRTTFELDREVLRDRGGVLLRLVGVVQHDAHPGVRCWTCVLLTQRAPLVCSDSRITVSKSSKEVTVFLLDALAPHGFFPI